LGKQRACNYVPTVYSGVSTKELYLVSKQLRKERSAPVGRSRVEPIKRFRATIARNSEENGELER